MTVGWMAGVVLLAGLFTSRTGVIYWQLFFCLFGAAAALELPALGGASILPSVLFLPFLAARALAENYGHRYSQRVPVAGFWLGCAVFYGVLTAFFMPRIFAGEVNVIAVDRSGDAGMAFAPLRPVSGNITQSGYALGALVAFLAMRALLEKPGRLVHFRDAVLLVAGLNCAAAILNLAEFYLGLPSILDYVRSAYTLFGAYELAGAGLMRIHGTFSEASAFSGFTLPLLAFSFSLWLHNVRSFYTGTLAALLATFLLISTSATAYVGLALYFSMLVFVLTYRGYVRGTIPRIGLLVAGVLLAIVILGSTFVLETEIARRLEAYFEITVVNKSETSSGMLRALWNRQAWSNFIDTNGLGVGLGTVRASSFSLVLLANLGALGTLLYLAFLKHVFVTPVAPGNLEPISEASRQALLASLSAALVSCAVFDLGVAFYAYAAAASIVLVEERPQAQWHGSVAQAQGRS